MLTETSKALLKSKLREYLESKAPSTGKGSICCPVCGSGTKSRKTSALMFDPKKHNEYAKCFSCNTCGDVFDWYKAINNNQQASLEEIGQQLSQELAISIETTSNTSKHESSSKSTYNAPAKEQPSYTALYREAHKRVNDTQYWKDRGLNIETINRFNIGYMKAWKHPKAPTSIAQEVLIIPVTPYDYVARRTAECDNKVKKVGSTRLFNIDALKGAGSYPIYVVEGEIDAMSIEQVGGHAVGLGSTGNATQLVNTVRQMEIKPVLLLALDEDDRGRETQKKLYKALQDYHIKVYEHCPFKGFKDPNEALQKNELGLTELTIKTNDQLRQLEINEDTEYLEQLERYIDEASNRNYVYQFLEEVSSLKDECIPTGFKELDKMLDGGLYSGLYVIGAISSLGKTTLALQIADQIAECTEDKTGKEVLIISLEMSKRELTAKSLSRLTAKLAVETEGKDISSHGLSLRELMKHITYTPKTEEQRAKREHLTEAISLYGERIAHNIYIVEGIGEVTADEIRRIVENHKKITGSAPVVIVDYMQILAPHNPKATDKQNTDYAVLELKRISRDYNIPVIGISSFNRANYKEAVSMEAFKESGAIEYSSDVLIGLQLKGAGGKKTITDKNGVEREVASDFNVNEAKRKVPREVELVILKNRNGRVGENIAYKLYAKHNLFIEEKAPHSYFSNGFS